MHFHKDVTMNTLYPGISLDCWNLRATGFHISIQVKVMFQGD